ncbi:glycerate kinase [Geodermatophilus sp. YIM 151500]|uniref:glycerate kinase n=1 Tax=Geodermatophilus sp. YIM 151500 TaxID=2984531 RepID=UPI0021E4A992|nr:glycerate kinase [Geodermatophilus sp. YIM 151500]MCV2490881.1 glycerate kinase [Geodermatophilus sp. YIM 151500]
MPRVLVAPDKFKGSLPATEVAAAVARGLTRARPDVEVTCLPVADGGDGTLDAAVAAGFERVPVTATGPTGEPVDTAYGRRGDTAVVEMADVSGLVRLPGGRLAARTATSRGTGELIAAALEAGARQVVLGIGGSATTDGGAGLLQALGARLLDADGGELGPGGAALEHLAGLDLSGLHPALREARVVVACDVDNPLTGPTGAAAVYGPQKGADPDDVAFLDRCLARLADAVAEQTGRDLRDEPGAGAAGGVGFAALAVLGATLRPGIDLLLELLDFAAHVRGTDLVVTGEGSLDEQTLHGKAPVGVARRARAAGASVVAVCGVRKLSDDRLLDAGIDAAYALADLEPDPARSMAGAAPLLEVVGARVAAERLRPPAPR